MSEFPSADAAGVHIPLTGPTRLPDGGELVLRVMPLPADVNGNGDIFGGWLMAQVDLAGAVLPSRIAKGRIATVAVNEFIFKQPVSVGDLVSFYARVPRSMSRDSPPVWRSRWKRRLKACRWPKTSSAICLAAPNETLAKTSSRSSVNIEVHSRRPA